MIIVLVSGKAESGKDTFYKLAVEECSPYRHFIIQRLAFGDYVKDIALQLGWNGAKDERGRALLQWIGDGARQFDRDVWVKKAFKDLTTHVRLPDVLIITDCRYPNEAIKMQTFPSPCFVVRIERPKHINSLTADQRNNTSETAMDDFPFDYVISNEFDDLTAYRNSVRSVMDDIIQRVNEKILFGGAKGNE